MREIAVSREIIADSNTDVAINEQRVDWRRRIAATLGLSAVLATVGLAYETDPANPNRVTAEASPSEEIKQGTHDFDNAKIVDMGMSEVGSKFATGWGNPGECMVSAQRWTTAANGGKNIWNYTHAGVISTYTDSGAVEVGLDKLRPGDILQRASTGGDADTNWDHVHTVVFRGHGENGTVKIVDSNRNLDGVVRSSDSYSLYSPIGWGWRAFRMGKVNDSAASTSSTPSAPVGLRAPSVVYDTDTGKNVFHAGPDGALWQWADTGGQWRHFRVGGSVAGNTTPSAVVDNVTHTGRNVFFVSGDHTIHQEAVSGGGWVDFPLGGMPALANTSPAATVDSTYGRQVFYVGEDHAIWQWSVSDGHWVNFRVGGNAADNTTPTVIDNDSFGRQVFYVHAADNTVNQLVPGSGGWTEFTLGGTVAGNSSPTAVIDKATGRNVFFIGTDGAMYQWSTDSNGWTQFRLGGAAAGNTSPVATDDDTNGRNVFFVGGDGTPYQWSVVHDPSDHWVQYALGPGSAPADHGTSFAAMDAAQTNRQLFYTGTDGAMQQWSVSGSAWTPYRVG